ncbi:MAG: alpha/beta fold hydrolase [Silvibacterium sp.]
MSWPLGKEKQTGKVVKRPIAATEPAAMSGRWLAGAMGVVVVLALLCIYGTLLLLFYQGQWQFLLHPVKSITAVPQAKFDEVHFDYTETGVARLDGWWIPAEVGARWSGDTILYLHGGRGSLSDAVNDLDALHALGINVFAFDYRGYGKSAGPHPNEARMSTDADAAWTYLTATRHLDPKTIVFYGAGVGASLAAELAMRHTPAGVILDTPSDTARKITTADARTKVLPLWLLLDERFDPAGALKALAAPKLFLDRNGAKPRTEELYLAADSPKQYFELKRDGAYEETLERFLDGLSLH